MTSADDTALAKPHEAKHAAPRRRHGRAAAATGQPKTRRANPARALWGKGQAAARSAQLLLQAGDWDGATNRAYYAAFSAARAVLASVRASFADAKGHATIVRRFEKHLVGERGLDAALGRPLFGRLRHARWVADYSDSVADEATARAVLGEAQRFMAATEPFLKKAGA
jgi:uncharacterized protein (UPF0332 family)